MVHAEPPPVQRSSPAQRRPHDPLVCGLGWDMDCDACRAGITTNAAAQSHRDVAASRWRRLILEHRLLRRLELTHHTLPVPDAKLLADLVALLLSPDTWQVLAELILDVLCDYAPLLADAKPCHQEEPRPASEERVYGLLLALERRPEMAQALARIMVRAQRKEAA